MLHIILKNIWGTFVRHFKTGSAADKFTKKQLLHFHRRVANSIAEIIHKQASGEWNLEDAKKKMTKTVKHAYGDHQLCDENCPRIPGIFMEHGKMTLKVIQDSLNDFINCHFGDKYLKNLQNTGTTSPVEYLHSTMIRRRLWVKGTQVTPLDQRYEVASSMTILIYNDSQDSAFRKVLNELDYCVPEAGLVRLQRVENERKSQMESKQKKKKETQRARREAQKQFQNQGSYASQVQRDIDNARQSSLTKKKAEIDGEFDEHGRPPDEEEDSDEELEV